MTQTSLYAASFLTPLSGHKGLIFPTFVCLRNVPAYIAKTFMKHAGQSVAFNLEVTHAIGIIALRTKDPALCQGRFLKKREQRSG